MTLTLLDSTTKGRFSIEGGKIHTQKLSLKTLVKVKKHSDSMRKNHNDHLFTTSTNLSTNSHELKAKLAPRCQTSKDNYSPKKKTHMKKTMLAVINLEQNLK